MKRIKIISIVGNRPQFIKLAMLIPQFKKFKNIINHLIIHTGQHFDNNMSDIFFKQLEITNPKYNLGIGSGTHGENTGRMIEKIEKILLKENPTGLLVYGDTDTTLAASISSSKLNIKLLHVESGLRSFNKNMPEEINRIITDHISFINFTPTKNAKMNLINEGISKKNIYNVGDIMLDSVLFHKKTSKFMKIEKTLNLRKLDYFLLTIHRAENTKNSDFIIFILNKLSKLNILIIWPLHPRVKKLIKLKKFKIPHNIKITDTFDYLETLAHIKNAKLILTDSGGLQKEAYFFEKPTVILRDRTEWIEIENNKSCIVLKNKNKLLKSIEEAINLKIKRNNDFGYGNCAENIVKILMQKLK